MDDVWVISRFVFLFFVFHATFLFIAVTSVIVIIFIFHAPFRFFFFLNYSMIVFSLLIFHSSFGLFGNYSWFLSLFVLHFVVVTKLALLLHLNGIKTFGLLLVRFAEILRLTERLMVFYYIGLFRLFINLTFVSFRINERKIFASGHRHTKKAHIVFLLNRVLNGGFIFFGKNKLQMLFSSAELFSHELTKHRGTLI